MTRVVTSRLTLPRRRGTPRRMRKEHARARRTHADAYLAALNVLALLATNGTHLSAGDCVRRSHRRRPRIGSNIITPAWHEQQRKTPLRRRTATATRCVAAAIAPRIMAASLAAAGALAHQRRRQIGGISGERHASLVRKIAAHTASLTSARVLRRRGIVAASYNIFARTCTLVASRRRCGGVAAWRAACGSGIVSETQTRSKKQWREASSRRKPSALKAMPRRSMARHKASLIGSMSAIRREIRTAGVMARKRHLVAPYSSAWPAKALPARHQYWQPRKRGVAKRSILGSGAAAATRGVSA